MALLPAKQGFLQGVNHTVALCYLKAFLPIWSLSFPTAEHKRGRRKLPPPPPKGPGEKCHQKVVLKTWSEGSGIRLF